MKKAIETSKGIFPFVYINKHGNAMYKVPNGVMSEELVEKHYGDKLKKEIEKETKPEKTSYKKNKKKIVAFEGSAEGFAPIYSAE